MHIRRCARCCSVQAKVIQIEHHIWHRIANGWIKGSEQSRLRIFIVSFSKTHSRSTNIFHCPSCSLFVAKNINKSFSGFCSWVWKWETLLTVFFECAFRNIQECFLFFWLFTVNNFFTPLRFFFYTKESCQSQPVELTCGTNLVSRG